MRRLCLALAIIALCGSAGCGSLWYGSAYVSAAERAELIAGAQKLGIPIVITRVAPGVVLNGLGEVALALDWVNCSGKTIKYARFTFLPYNAVGDRIPCAVRGHTPFIGTVTGPVEHGRSFAPGDVNWRRVWYNASFECARLTEVDLEFMDGDRIIIRDSAELVALLADSEHNERVLRCMQYGTEDLLDSGE